MQLDLVNTELPMRAPGRVQSIVHSAPRDRLWRLLHHKRWYYVAFASDDLLFAGSIVSLGYMNKAFVYLADRNDGRMRFHHELLLPAGPWVSVTPDSGRFASPLLSLRLSRHLDQTLFTTRARGLRVQLGFQERAAPLTVATMLAGGATHVTEKTLGMDAAGEICGQSMRGCGAVDYTDGFVPRHTRWKWASFSSPQVSLNLTQGFVGAPECFAVVGHKHVPLGNAVISMPEDPMQPWRVASACGKVDLTFTPFALHADSTDLGVIHAKFRQPIGTFVGHVAGVSVDGPIGVCEDQDVLW